MSPRHRLDRTGECEKRGTKAEQAFLKYVKTFKDWDGKPSSDKENTGEHKDFTLFNSKTKKTYYVDVKGLKKIARYDKSLSFKYTWLEYDGTTPGRHGWILGGKADYIVFSTGRSWLFVSRKKLVKFVKEILATEPRIVHDPHEAELELEKGLYTRYPRAKNRGKLILVKLSTLEKMAEKGIK